MLLTGKTLLVFRPMHARVCKMLERLLSRSLQKVELFTESILGLENFPMSVSKLQNSVLCKQTWFAVTLADWAIHCQKLNRERCFCFARMFSQLVSVALVHS